MSLQMLTMGIHVVCDFVLQARFAGFACNLRRANSLRAFFFAVLFEIGLHPLLFDGKSLAWRILSCRHRGIA